MTLQSYLTLRLLKKVQIVEDGRILLRHEDLTICTIVKQGQRQVTRNLSKRKDSLSSRLAYLEKNDCRTNIEMYCHNYFDGIKRLK